MVELWQARIYNPKVNSDCSRCVPSFDIIFIRHASTLRTISSRSGSLPSLLSKGYAVFCDLIDFKGGEDFWRDAEAAIRSRAAKVVYILSRTSNVKQGPLNELRVASNVARDHDLHDFILPIAIDDLPPRDANIEIARLNIISAEQNWAGALRVLLEKLNKDSIPQTLVSEVEARIPQWRDRIDLSAEVREDSELYVSNWFPIVNAPSQLFVHNISGFGDLRTATTRLPWPAIAVKWSIVSFAEASEISAHLPRNFRVTESIEIPATGFSPNSRHSLPSDLDVVRSTAWLYRLAFERLCRRKGLISYRMANRAQCLFFPSRLLNGDKVHIKLVDGRTTWKKLTGYKSVGLEGQRQRRHWHFGIQARPLFQPIQVFSLTPHVVFSDDGRKVWPSTERLHRARRSQCKDWWNDDWRDRLLGAMAWLAVDGLVSIPISTTSSLDVSAIPVLFDSPVSFSDPGEVLTTATIDAVEEE